MATRTSTTTPKPQGADRPGTTASSKRVIAVGKRVDGRWQVRTSLWRYLAATALSKQ